MMMVKVILRMFYLVDGTTTTYKDSTAGTINYKTGEIILTNVNITSTSSVDGVTSSSFRILVKPDSNDILGVRNQVLRLDTSNLTISATTDTIASGSTSHGVGATITSSYSGETSSKSSHQHHHQVPLTHLAVQVLVLQVGTKQCRLMTSKAKK